MSQLSSSVLAIATGFPIFGELMHFVLGQQIIANVLLPVGQLTDTVGHHPRRHHGEQAGDNDHADAHVAPRPNRPPSHPHQQPHNPPPAPPLPPPPPPRNANHPH